MPLAAEAELEAIIINAKEDVHLQQILHKMGHPQPPMPIQTDNSTAEGVINLQVHPNWKKMMDMQFKWLLDCKAKQQF
jgi:hypothetical protein